MEDDDAILGGATHHLVAFLDSAAIADVIGVDADVIDAGVGTAAPAIVALGGGAAAA
jgi:hypothetical protein